MVSFNYNQLFIHNTWHFPGLNRSSILIDLRLSEHGISFEQSSLFIIFRVAISH